MKTTEPRPTSPTGADEAEFMNVARSGDAGRFAPTGAGCRPTPEAWEVRIARQHALGRGFTGELPGTPSVIEGRDPLEVSQQARAEVIRVRAGQQGHVAALNALNARMLAKVG